MKFLIIISSLVLIPFTAEFALAAKSTKCPGEEGYYFINMKHRNPTQGGFVSNKADVQDTDDYIFIGPEAAICGSSSVSGRARIFGTAVISDATVNGTAEIKENARISDGAVVSDNARISGNAKIYGSVEVKGNALVTENAELKNYNSEKLVKIEGDARISGSARVSENANVGGTARVSGNAKLSGNVKINGDAQVKGFTKRSTGTISSGTLDEPDYEAIEAARLKKLADEKRCREEAELEKAKNAAAEIAEKARKQKEEDDLQTKLAEIRNSILEIAKKVNLKVVFSKENCAMAIQDQAHRTLNFDFTSASRSFARPEGRSGVRVEDAGDGDYNLTIESEPHDPKETVTFFAFFSANNKSYVEKFKGNLDFYYDHCKALKTAK